MRRWDRRGRWRPPWHHHDWHEHDPHCGPRRGRVRSYVSSRLHRKIFVWFGLSILITCGVAWTVFAIVRPAGHGWRDDMQRAENHVGHSFERVWDDPKERETFAARMAEDLDVAMMVKDADGGRPLRYGKRECGPFSIEAPVRRDGRVLGSVTVCRESDVRHPLVLGLVLLTACVTLWAMSGKIARRMTRPLNDLVRVTREIGAGKLTARVRLGHHEPGEVGVLSNAINDMAVRIEKQMADQRELLAAVSHEVRTPLTRIRVLLELARDKGADATQMDGIEREVLEIDSLVGELLASSRVDFAAVSWHELDAVELAKLALARADLPESLLVSELDDPRFEGDPTLLARALANLLDNGKIHGRGIEAVRLSQRGGQLVFAVEDRGPGFGHESLRRAFDSFYRGNNGDKSKSSLGLGLSLVRRIARAHGGSAWAKNREPQGAIVAIEVRRQRPQPDSEAPPSSD